MEDKYFQGLLDRWHEVEIIEQRRVEAESWKPRRAWCHQNVDRWIELNPHLNLKPVRGWLIESEFARRWFFVAHSAVQDGNVLYDVTLRAELPVDSDLHTSRFLRHRGTDAEFFAHANVEPQLWYPRISEAEWIESMTQHPVSDLSDEGSSPYGDENSL